jgi:hypothetical protein
MGKAKTLTAQQLRRVQDYIASRAHAARNRAMLLLTHLAGMRVGEVAARTCVNSDLFFIGTIRPVPSKRRTDRNCGAQTELSIRPAVMQAVA